jgi:hypothetical protein
MKNFNNTRYDFCVRKCYKEHQKKEFITKMINEKKYKMKSLQKLANTCESKIEMHQENDIIEYIFDAVKDLVYYEKPRFKLYKEEETNDKEIIKLQKTTMINANGDLNVLFKNLFPEISLTLFNDKKKIYIYNSSGENLYINNKKMKIYYYKSGDKFHFNNSCLKKLYLKLKNYHLQELDCQIMK